MFFFHESNQRVLTTLQGDPANIDAFTGGQKNFVPLIGADCLYFGDSVEEHPPRLPGYDINYQLHFARGETGGPLFYSPNILPSDPLFIRLAYMRFPITLEDIRILLTTMIPRNILLTGQIEGSPNAYNSKAKQVIEARESMTPEQRSWEYEISVLTGEEISSPYSPSSVVISDWRACQYLSAAVLWSWGRVAEPGPVSSFYSFLGESAKSLYGKTHYTFLNFPGENEEDPVGREDLQRAYKKSGTSWLSKRSPISLGLLSEQLYDTINTAGTKLLSCRHCGRLAERIRRREFCSDYCRSAHFMSQKGKPKELRNIRVRADVS